MSSLWRNTIMMENISRMNLYNEKGEFDFYKIKPSLSEYWGDDLITDGTTFMDENKMCFSTLVEVPSEVLRMLSEMFPQSAIKTESYIVNGGGYTGVKYSLFNGMIYKIETFDEWLND